MNIEDFEDVQAVKAKSKEEIESIIKHYWKEDLPKEYFEAVPAIANKIYNIFNIQDDLVTLSARFRNTYSIVVDDPICDQYWLLLDFFDPYEEDTNIPIMFGNMNYEVSE